MLRIKKNYTCDHIKYFLVIVIISFILIPLVIGSIKFNSNIKLNDTYPKLNDFSKNDYTAILSEEKYGLGNIVVNDIDFSQLDPGFFIYNTSYPLIWTDYDSAYLNWSQPNMKFVETIEPAIVDNIDENIIDSNKIIVKLNENVFFEHNDLTQGYLIYHPRLVPCELLQLFVNNGSDIFELKTETDYYIDTNDFIVFDYKNYFQERPNSNFTLNFLWEYTLDINDWSLSQITKQNLIMTEEEHSFNIKFNYKFLLTGQKYNESIATPDNTILADNIDIALTVNPPDKNLLNDHTLELNQEIVNIGDHLEPDNSVDVHFADHFTGEQSIFSLNFTTLFILKFTEPVGETWAIDRLIEKNNIRQRIYFPSITTGPQHIYLKNISFYEPAIYVEQIISNSSLFGRSFAYFHLNTTLTGRQGIKIKIPYLIVGETCPSIIKYEPTQTLRVVVTDNIKMPLIGANVKVYYFGQEYGTYISKNRTQPIAPGKTNENGEIVLKYIPAGNYTIKVYYHGILLKNSIGSTYNIRNYINTVYPHFPLWIVIFGIFNGIILIFGAIFYIKYKKTR